MRRVIVDRKKWLRGKRVGSLLLNEKGKMCCIGFLARRLGCKPKELLNQGTLEEVQNPAADDFHTTYELELDEAYNTNDSPDIEDDQREADLAYIGRKMDVRFIFRG